MLSFILNPLLLFGLLGIALPIIAHLLSRRKYDVVEWGAMQFLNPSRKTRRKMKLEELLLLLIRILTIVLIVFALARPWINSGFLLGYHSAGSRDVVLVVDGSNSMGRSDGLTSLHEKAIRRAKEFLDSLRPGDTVAIIDARDRPVRVIDSPLQDHEVVKATLDEIPPPLGAANLRQACEEAVGILGRGSNGSREIVVLTDRQRAGWSLDDDSSWRRFDEVLKFPSVRPSVWVVDVSDGLAELKQNVSIGVVSISRDITVPDSVVEFQAPIRNAGSSSVTVPIQVLVNGQRVAGMDASVTVPPGSETTFSQSLRFSAHGTNLLTVRTQMPKDSLPADNESHAAVHVSSAIPVLLVESSNSLKRARWNSFFAELALTTPENDSPWVLCRVVHSRDFSAKDLDSVSAVLLPDVSALDPEALSALSRFVSQGNGAFISLGDGTTAQSFDDLYGKSGLFSNLKLKRVKMADPDAVVPTTIAPYSLKAPWLDRFRERKGASLFEAVFERWWLVEITSNPEPARLAPQQSSDRKPLDTDPMRGSSGQPITIAQLTSGDPLLLQTTMGKGNVLLMTSSLDADWNSFPGKGDYVPFLHESLFHMVASKTKRNVQFGAPLVSILPSSTPATIRDELSFSAPFDRTEDATIVEESDAVFARLSGTRLPGIYKLSNGKADAAFRDTFVVNYDHSEDNPIALNDNDQGRLIVNDRMSFVDSIATLRKEMYGGETRSEIWTWLLWMFLGLVTLEVWMTRRLVLQGHADTDAAPPPESAST